MNADETLAVILSELKKLTKHFKLDRRRQGEGENPTNAEDAASDGKMLQQIAATVKELSERGMRSDEQLNKIINGAGEYLHQKQNSHLATLKPVLEAMAEKLDELPTGPQNTTIRREHHFSVDFRNIKAALTMIAMGFIILVSLGFNIHQANRSNTLRDNDIKYRYIEMRGSVTSKEILMLREVFDYNRNADSIHLIRQRVERYEQLIRKEAETEARAQLNAEQAEQARKEAESVRQKGN